MGVIVATTVGLVVWIVLWALGVKAFDSAILAAAIVLVVATMRIALRYVPGFGGR
jgi:predicted PurR-regulated permease PerM